MYHTNVHTNPTDLHLADLQRRLSAYEAADLVACAGALQLVPQNAECAIRVEVLAHVMASIQQETGKPRIRRSTLNRLANGGALASPNLKALQDPVENLFVEEAFFIGGGYRVLPGISEEATYIQRHLSQAICLRSDGILGPGYVDQVKRLYLTGLRLSESVAERAGLLRGQMPESDSGDRISIPDQATLDDLKAAVFFSEDDLSSMASRRQISHAELDLLTCDLGNFDLESVSAEEGVLHRRPFVQTPGGVVVALPWEILPALNHQAISLAVRHDEREKVAVSFRDTVWLNVVESLRHLHLYVIRGLVEASNEAPETFKEAFFNLDADKVLYVQLLTDSLQDWDSDRVNAGWHAQASVDWLASRAAEVEETLFTSCPAPNEMVVLLVLQSVGRSFACGMRDHLDSPTIVLTAAGLETIATLQAGNPLALYEYARASSLVRDRAVISAMSTLDEFGFYRSCGYSYYASDDVRPDYMSILPGYAGALRKEAFDRTDRHTVRSYHPGLLCEVVSRYSDRSIPICVPLLFPPERVALVVDLKPIPIWVLGPGLDASSGHSHAASGRDVSAIVETIAYWLWQCSGDLDEVMKSLAERFDQLQVEVDLATTNEGEEPRSSATEARLAESVSIEVNEALGRLIVGFSSNAWSFFGVPDNSGEREFVEGLLAALLSMASPDVCVAGGEIASLAGQIAGRHAPLGLKKMLLALEIDKNPELEFSPALPPARKVQPAAQQEILDHLGEHLTQRVGLPTGPIPADQRVDVLNRHVVAFHYVQLQKMAASLRPDGLLEALIALNEALLRRDAYQRLTIPTQIACFGDREKVLEDLSSRIPELNEASLASRFLIEYVVTRAPEGVRPLSLSVYDRMLAIANQIVQRAYESDVLNYKISEVELSLLPSGRLGTRADTYTSASKDFLAAYAAGEVGRAETHFGRHWSDGSVLEPPSDLDRLEVAHQAEFGFRLTEVMDFLFNILNLGYDQQTDCKRLPYTVFVEELTKRTGWTKERTSECIQLMSLEARHDFLEPPPPFERVEVYPWRFNRRLSYIRRPLLIRGSGEAKEILWGTRHTYLAARHWFHLCMSARLPVSPGPRGSQLRGLFGEFVERQGREFNDAVVAAFTRPGLVVRGRVRRIGRLRIQEDGNNLGDIDCLVANARRHKLLAVECKDLSVARNPHELARELQTLFVNDDCAVNKHSRRVEWVKRNLTHVLEFLGVPASDRWSVDGLLVVDEEIFSPHLYQSPFDVLALREVHTFVDSWA